MRAMQTVQDKMRSAGASTGFDYLRIILAVAILIWHAIWNASGSAALENQLWTSPLRFLPLAIIPLFFALSGFLVAGSLERNSLHGFLTLRIIRIVPALAVEITLSAFIIGLLFTDLPLAKYLTSIRFYKHFFNIIGWVHYTLPGVFLHNPAGDNINAQLWTIPWELQCYLWLSLLSVLTIFARRRLFATLILALTFAITAWLIHKGAHISVTHVAGWPVVFCFLAAVLIYLYRDVLPYSHALGVISGVAAIICLEIPAILYLAPFPIAYFTVWIGLMRFRPIPFGDLSYGVYLFHYPIEQTLMHLFPWIKSWWVLTAMALPLTAGFAFLSWNLIEHPVLKRKKQALAVTDRLVAAVRRAVLVAPHRVETAGKEQDAV